VTPYLQDPDLTLWHGDALEVLRQLPSESVDCVATSPPFYALRDYGVEGQIGLSLRQKVGEP
jgi:DNA modification methylase